MVKFTTTRQILLLISLILAIPSETFAQRNNLDDLILAVGSEETKSILIGSTGGTYSLASISNKDKEGNPCIGYGDPKPDHIMTLKSNFSRLKLQIDSAGNETTLVVKAVANNQIRCGFGQNNRQDALIEDRNWSAGTYHIWVGSVRPNQRSQYRLSVER